MRKICIAHLSDLHIGPNQPPGYDRVRKNLIEDLKSTIKNNSLSLDSVAVTGDIVDRGGSEVHYKIASDFLRDIAKELNIDRGCIAIVPGNHDIPRRDIVTECASKYDVDYFSKLECQRFEEYWESLGVRFRHYNSFVDGIVPDYCRYKFGAGIRQYKTPSGIKVRFLLLNSAWLSSGESDQGRIGVGKWQLESLQESQKDTEISDITIALLHHPIQWLNENDRNCTLSFLPKRQNRLNS